MTGKILRLLGLGAPLGALGSIDSYFYLLLGKRFMARPLRIEYPGAYYHVTSRGNERKAITGVTDVWGIFFRVATRLY